MIDTVQQIMVRRVVAKHLSVDWSEIKTADRLEGDLSLRPLDVVLIAMRLEDLEGVEVPIDLLDSVTTVGELADLVGQQLVAGQRAS